MIDNFRTHASDRLDILTIRCRCFCSRVPCENPVVWYLNSKWCHLNAQTTAGKRLINARNRDRTRDDKTYVCLYMKRSFRRFALLENPYLLNERLIIQKGVFLCPGDISVPLEDNLKAMAGWNAKDSITKMRLEFTAEER